MSESIRQRFTQGHSCGWRLEGKTNISRRQIRCITMSDYSICRRMHVSVAYDMLALIAFISCEWLLYQHWTVWNDVRIYSENLRKGVASASVIDLSTAIYEIDYRLLYRMQHNYYLFCQLFNIVISIVYSYFIATVVNVISVVDFFYMMLLLL